MTKNKTVFYALFVMLLWGTLFPVVKLGYLAYNVVSTGDILYFAGVRFTICGIVICIYSYFKSPESFADAFKNIYPVLLSGFFAIILHYSFTYLGLKFIDSSKTAILKQVGTIFYVCFSCLFFKNDRLTYKKLIAVVLGLMGILVINTDSGRFSLNLGTILIVLASFCTVFSNVISKKVFENVNQVTSTGISQLFGGLVLLLAGRLLGGSMSFGLFPGKILILLYICTASVISYCIWFTVVKSGELSKLFIIKFAEPVFACIFGAMILKEDVFNIHYLIAFLLIGSGIYISNK